MSAPQEFDTAKDTFDSVEHFVDALDADMLHSKANKNDNTINNNNNTTNNNNNDNDNTTNSNNNDNDNTTNSNKNNNTIDGNNNNNNNNNTHATSDVDATSTNDISNNNNNDNNNNNNGKTANSTTNDSTACTNGLDSKINDQDNDTNIEGKISNSDNNVDTSIDPANSKAVSTTDPSSNEAITVSNIQDNKAATVTSTHDRPSTTVSADSMKDTNESDNIDSSKTNDMENKKSLKKFWEGMRFYINDAQDAHDNMNDAKLLVRLISDNGGEVLDKLPNLNDPTSSTPDGNLLVVSPYNDTNLVTVSPTYIKACVQSNTLLNYQNYLVPFDKNRISNNEKKENNEQNAISNDSDNAENQSDGSFDTNVAANNILSNDNLNAAVAVANTTVTTTTTAATATPTPAPTTGTGTSTTNSANTDSMPSNNENKVNLNDKADTLSIDNFKQRENPVKADVESELSMVDTSDSNGNSLKHTPLPPNFSSHKNVFSEDEDQFILDVVRKNPTRRSTHTLFEEISRFMPNHTGNSIRHRYRGYLSKRLDFVYQVDKNGKLVRDERGNLIKTDVLPPSLKRKFTADEDYGLAIAIKKQFYRDAFQVDPESGSSLITHQETAVDIAKRNMTMDPHHVPGNEPSFKDFRVYGRRGPVAREFFKTYAELVPTHTESAWRDRFRKFLLVFGIDAYIDYYEECKAIGKEPEPLKNMTVRKKRRGDLTPGNYNSSLKRVASESESVFDPMSSKRRHYMESTEPELIKVDENTGNIGVTNDVVTNNGNNNMPNTGVSLENKNINAEDHSAGKLTSNEPHVTLEQTPFGETSHHKSVSAGTIIENSKIKPSQRKTTEDYDNELLDEETRNFISSLKDDLNKINNNLPFEYPPDIAEAIRTDYAMEEMKYDTIDPDTIQWPPKIASMDLFLPKFFQLESTREFMKRVNDVISRDYEPSQAEMLVQNLADECGIRRNFCTAMLTSLSGDLMVIPRYFLNMFQTDTNPPSNVPGIWTASDDAMLRKGGPRELQELEKKHGSGRIEMRKRFIETALI